MGSATSTGKRARNGGGDDDSGGGGGAGGDKKPFGEFDADHRHVEEQLAKNQSPEDTVDAIKNKVTLNGTTLQGDKKKEGRLEDHINANTDEPYTPEGRSRFRDGAAAPQRGAGTQKQGAGAAEGAGGGSAAGAPCLHDNSSSSDVMFPGGPPAGGSSSSSSSSSSDDSGE
jgi:hypothetical protein